MKSPYFLIGDGSEIVSFLSEKDAEAYIEPDDARSGLFTVFDCEGREIKIEVRSRSPRRGLLGKIMAWLEPEYSVLSEFGSQPPQQEVLAAYLRQYLIHRDPDTRDSVEAMSFDALVAAVASVSQGGLRERG